MKIKKMTIIELLQKTEFDRVMDCIARRYPKQASMRPFYREAWDIILHTEPTITDDPIRVRAIEGGLPFSIDLEGWKWEKVVGCELELDDDVKCSDEELAAQCLWHLTFYGFTPEDMANAFPEEDEDPTLLPRRKRINLLINTFCDKCPDVRRGQLGYLYKTRKIQEVTYRSRAYDVNRRMDYLCETITQYLRIPLNNMGQISFVLTASSEHPLSDEERQRYDALIESLVTTSELMLKATGSDDSLGTELALLVVKSKARK